MKNIIDPRCEIVGNKLYLEGYILNDDLSDAEYITAAMVKKALATMSGDLEVHINSPGGLTSEAIDIYNLFKDYRHKVTIQIDGIAAGAALTIAMGGDTIRARRSSMIALDHPWGFAVGNASEIRAKADELDKTSQSVRKIYLERFKGNDAKLKDFMDKETFMGTDEAHSWGLIDEIIADSAKSLETKSRMNEIKAENKSFFSNFMKK
ncbi:ATP-dependent Clp protease proteolytic subunit [anaerobic digester metagenome]